MHPLRQVGRWSLTLLAVLLALVAVLLVALRLALTQVDQLAPRVVANCLCQIDVGLKVNNVALQQVATVARNIDNN